MKWRKRIALFTVIGCMAGIGPVQALAASSDEILEQIASYMADLEASQQKSEELEEEIASRQEEVGALFAEVTVLNIEKEDYYQEMKQRIAYFYEESQGFSLIGALFSASSFADFINRIQFQQSLYDYDSARLEEYQELVNEIEEKQSALDAEIASLGDMVEEQVVMQAALDAAIAVKQTEYDEAVEAEAVAAAEAAAREAAEREAARRAEEEAMAYALSYASSESSVTESSEEDSPAEPASVSEETASSSDTSSYEETSSYEDTSSSGETSSYEETSSSAETSAAGTASSSSGSYNYPTGSGILTYTGGVNYFNGHMETWYTMRQWTGDLGIPGMYIGSDGIVRDGDGYICVASDDDPKGTIVETSLGTGKVYDSGPGHGIIDIYTDWPPY